VGPVGDDVQFGTLDCLGRPLPAGLERDDGVAITVDEQGRNLARCQVLAEVGGAEGGDAVGGALWRGECSDALLEPALGLAHLQFTTGAEKACSELVQECHPVPGHPIEEALDSRLVERSIGVVGGLEQERGDRC
jgi:hypothetical protein